MKLKKIKFNNHKILNDLEVDFCDGNGIPLDTIVIIGENGTGKTTLLKSVMEFMNADERDFERDKYGDAIENINGRLELQINNDEGSFLQTFFMYGVANPQQSQFKVIYMPAEINFDKLKKVDNTFKFLPSFLNIVDQSITENVPSFIATNINKEIFRNRNKIIGEVIDKVCDEINSIFSIMDLDVKLIGLSEDEDTKPVFKNSLGKEFDINGLSSGEKQLFLRGLSLKFLEANNSIILIDEPEISLHPEWQQKIIKVYENIGLNNQLIIATHSPHIVGDIKAEQLRILIKDINGVSLLDNDKIDETYGHTIENILKTTMKLDNLRNDDISERLKEVLVLLEKDLFETPEFNEKFDYLRKYLGDFDKDIMLINLEKSRRKRR
ncbi:AAA family ATPase [Clostridium estertheticum]|uniref:AAA family ATPase n=1 Tax=Clostridium estertheticum TaxID=238834 RepID=UPI001C7D3D55|nr:AAA family ATPase [Clostridium estertheticum]MBX4271075.1 ATP-binding protein [Clostridium estertheticum]MCB2356438.1 ATP-binding protein [Clostridium estertheticum]WAG39618.1 ATP-binding protein [Clostridium estertheticum]WLC78309.1 ATP-binding protein [Clostridium estertheticum]